MKKELRIPIAQKFKTNDLILPAKATKEDGPFVCPNCHKQVVLRKCSARCRTHFSHIATEQNMSCSTNESLIHNAAKHIVAMYPTYFRFQERCMGCKESLNSKIIKFKDSETSTVEFRLGSYVVDVAMHNNHGQLIAIVEIRHTHAIESEKWTALHSFTDYVFEVNATEIVHKFDPAISSKVIGCVRKQESFCDSCTKKRTETCVVCSLRVLKKSMHSCRNSKTYICSKCVMTVAICKECNSDICSNDSTMCRPCKWKIEYNIKLWQKSLTLLNMIRLQQVQERHALFYSLSNNFVSFILRRKLRRCFPIILQKRHILYHEQKTTRKRQLLDDVMFGNPRFDLDVNYEDKEIAKIHGCRWDPKNRKWFVVGRSIFDCLRWLPQNRQLHPVTKRVCYRNEDREVLMEEHPNKKDLT